MFFVLFVCKCLLYHCHRVFTQLQLTNISNYVQDLGLYGDNIKMDLKYLLDRASLM